MNAWWEAFFDGEYLSIWSALTSDKQTAHEADALWRLLGLEPGTRVLDAPCGFGRISQKLAERGARVVGVDQSAHLLAEAERRRGPIGTDQLRYLRHDLREPLEGGQFDVALNLLNSIGYGTDDDDLAVFTTLAQAVRPGGTVVVDTMHRDATAVYNTLGLSPSRRTPDGTIVIHETRFDPIAGRADTTWSWSGPSGSGQRTTSIRSYCITELVALLRRAGLTVQAVYAGYSSTPYDAHAPRPTPVLLVADRPAR